eukprot:gb/GEZN01010329.1/.p1 GENE.gb/GEZN01010329.1/~~gb/GEZN01010329.1/.p1  ORF type:complete len:301 (+),score=26.40 gb/GEZN01010329.1/:80-982(+)
MRNLFTRGYINPSGAEGLVNMAQWKDLFLSDSARLLRARDTLDQVGMVSFSEFLAPTALQAAAAESQKLAPHAFRTDAHHNAYQLPPDRSLPPSHIRNMPMRTRVASTAFDELQSSSVLRRLYTWPGLEQFMTILTGRPCYRLGDPLGCVSINVFYPGWDHAWHFDEAETTVTLCLQAADSGGEFHFTRLLRDSAEDMAFPQVSRVVRSHSPYKPDRMDTAGEVEESRTEIQTADFRPGTLMVFRGRYSLHRVATVQGQRPRLVAVLCFAEKPGVVNSPEVQSMFWGRVLQPAAIIANAA